MVMGQGEVRKPGRKIPGTPGTGITQTLLDLGITQFPEGFRDWYVYKYGKEPIIREVPIQDLTQFKKEQPAQPLARPTISWEDVKAKYPDYPPELWIRLKEQYPEGLPKPITERERVTLFDFFTKNTPDVVAFLEEANKAVQPDISSDRVFWDTQMSKMTNRWRTFTGDPHAELTPDQQWAASVVIDKLLKARDDLATQQNAAAVAAWQKAGAKGTAPTPTKMSMAQFLASKELQDVLATVKPEDTVYGFIKDLPGEYGAIRDIISDSALEGAMAREGRTKELQAQQQKEEAIITGAVGELPPKVMDYLRTGNPGMASPLTKLIDQKQKQVEQDTGQRITSDEAMGMLTKKDLSPFIEQQLYQMTEAGYLQRSTGNLHEAAQKMGMSTLEYMQWAKKTYGGGNYPVTPGELPVLSDLEYMQWAKKTYGGGNYPVTRGELPVLSDWEKSTLTAIQSQPEYQQKQAEVAQAAAGQALTQAELTGRPEVIAPAEAALGKAQAAAGATSGVHISPEMYMPPDEAQNALDKFLVQNFPGANVGLARREFPMLYDEYKSQAQFTANTDFGVYLQKKGKSHFAPFVSFPVGVPQVPMMRKVTGQLKM